MGATQGTRPIAVAGPLDEDVLLFHRMTAQEELGRPFTFELSLLSDEVEIDPDDVLGEGMTIRFRIADGATRYFHGLVVRFVQDDDLGRHSRYRATLRPWLWFLNQTADCRIFQDMTVPDIVQQVFRDHGHSDFEVRLDGSYEPWTYCVQYRETAFNFVSRLMEQEGIYYFFRHEEGRHVLVLADSYSAHEAVPGYEEVRYGRFDARQRRDYERIATWRATRQVLPAVYALNDFNFEHPGTALHVRARALGDPAGQDFEIYDYPGDFGETGRGEAYARARLQGVQASHERFLATGTSRGLTTGALFTLTDHPLPRHNREHLVVAAAYELRSDEYETTEDLEEGILCHCRITAIEGATQFCPTPITLKPVVRGPQTAFVVGKEGEEIWTDEYGRVKLQFHWDRYGSADENSSCWVRVAQVWAGKKWGGIHIPRIGQEVIVEFLEGDPDRPIVTGRVYNRNTMPPYPLTQNATISTIKSNSSKGGEGFNEVRFEDKKGEEQLFLHAERNQDIRVKNDCFETIGRNRHLVVKQDQMEKVESNRNETVGGSHHEEIGGERHLKVKKLQAVEVGDSHSMTVTGDVHEKFGGGQFTQVSGDLSIQASNVCIKASSNITLKVGNSYVAIEAGGIKIASDGEIQIEAGARGSFKAAAGLTLKSDGPTEVEGLTLKATGTTQVEISGAVVKIN